MKTPDKIKKPKRRPTLHHYGVYGISLRSEIALPLPKPSGSPLLKIELRVATGPWFERASRGAEVFESTSWYEYSRLPDGSNYVKWDGVGEFLVSSNGKKVACRQFDDSATESFQVYLLGQAISFGLVKQGLEPLHATAVEVDGQAVVFLGGGGAGKSTLAAFFVSSGHRLLTDDLLVLQETPGGIVGYPGPARIKLFPALARRFLGREARGARMNPFTRKMILPLVASQLRDGRIPLRAIYTLAEPEVDQSETITIDPLSSRDAFIELVTHTFNRRTLDPDRLTRNFTESVRWANLGLVRRLTYPRDLKHLPALYDAIQKDLSDTRKDQRAVS